MEALATPPPHVSSGDEMDVDEEDHYLGPRDHNAGDDSPDDGSATV